MANVLFYEKPGCINNARRRVGRGAPRAGIDQQRRVWRPRSKPACLRPLRGRYQPGGWSLLHPARARQKVLLAAAGHTVQAKSLPTEKWTAERLRAFFGELPVAEWFNLSSPRVYGGEVTPEELDEPQAMRLIRATAKRRAGAPLGMRPCSGMPRAGCAVAGIASGVASHLRWGPCSALRRAPLMEAGGQRRAGFDQDAVDAWIGLGSKAPREDLETCTRKTVCAPPP